MIVYLLLLFFSGFSSLIYEVVWTKLLALTFGSTTIASTIVIMVFMLGLGIGGLYFGKKVDMIKKKVLLFSLLQFGTGFFSFALLMILPHLPFLYRAIFNTIHINPSNLIAVIFIFAFVVMFIPTFLMGGTLPVIVRMYVHKPDSLGKGVGILYGINILGGVLGAILAGFFLIRNIGMNFTQLIAIIVNILIGIVALVFAKKVRATGIEKESHTKQDFGKNAILADKILIKYIPLIAGFTGFAGLACEIFWIRALSVFLTNSTYTFTLILAIFLIGTFVGSIIFSKISKKYTLYGVFSIIQIALGLYIVIGCIFLHQLPAVLFSIQNLFEIPILRLVLPPVILSLLVVFFPTIAMGMSFPLMCTIYSRNMNFLGSKIGWVYFTNTLGSALGSFIAGIFLLSSIGIIRGLFSVALINLLIGILFTIFTKGRWLNYILVACFVISSFFALRNRYILPPSLYHTSAGSDRVLYYKETRDGTVIVGEDRTTGVRSCYVNNSAVIGTTYDAIKVVKMLGSLPFIFNPGARDILVIGFGVGITTSVIARYDITQIDCIEIVPGLREAAKYFANFNNYIFNNRKVKFIPNDGRNFLLLSDKKYDIISCDPTHPILGSGNLYTREYFLLCKNHLKEHGVVCQYLPFHKLSPNEFKTLIKSFSSVFSYTSIWLGYSHGILIGTDYPQLINFADLQNIKDNMLKDPYLVAISCILDNDQVLNLTEWSGINTDDRPILEFFTPASLKRENWELNIQSIFALRLDITRLINGIDDAERLRRYLRGQEYFIKGLIFQNRGDRQLMKEAFEKVLEINPENYEVRLFLQSQ
ncbi:MAG: fused MFS/spermidine synthase [bacterium]